MDDSPQISIDAQVSEKFAINISQISDVVTVLCKSLKIEDLETSLSFVDEPTIQKLNREFRNKDAATDVLSFPQQEWKTPLLISEPVHNLRKTPLPGPQALGDVVINLEYAEKNAATIGQGIDREVCFLIIHGILHLCGHDHLTSDEEEIMTAQQRELWKIIDRDQGRLWRGCVSSL
ncbi:MAG: rRNA maturation RNase YbeY [Oligoflexales bacterium]